MTKTLKPVIASDFCFILFDIFMQIEKIKQLSATYFYFYFICG